MVTTTPAIMATFGPSLFDSSSAVGSALGFCAGSVDSVGKIDNQIIACNICNRLYIRDH